MTRNAHLRSEGWLRDLTALLEENPRALVGEIGLDKVARTPDTRRVEWDDQLEVFHSQMALATKLSRPVSVHCVKAHGKLVECLREGHGVGSKKGGGGGKSDSNRRGRRDSGYGGGGGRGGKKGHFELSPRDRGEGEGWRLPPRIALHSFTGSVEVARDILRLGGGGGGRGGRGHGGGEVFFGFSAAVNMRGDRERKRLLEVLRAVPDSQLLIETDRLGPSTGTAAAELLRVCGAIAEAKGVSIEEAVALANRNACRFLEASAPTAWPIVVSPSRGP